MADPLVAALVLNWRMAEATLHCVADLRAGGYQNLKILVLDNGSGAEQEELLRGSEGAELMLLGENLGRLYSEKHGLEFVGMRIGWLIAEDDPTTMVGTPAEDYMRAMWLSHRDCVEAHRCATEADVSFANAYIISRNDRRVFDLKETEQVLGYRPKDNAEDHFR